MYQNTVTLFNKYEDSTGAVYWYPHVLEGVDLITDKAASIAATGLDNADEASLHVMYKLVDGEIYIGDLPYLPPKKWENQVGDDLPNSITFCSGDFFTEGEVELDGEILGGTVGTDVIGEFQIAYMDTVIADSDYATRVDGGFYDYLNKRRDSVYLITSASSPYTIIQHFEISGK